MAYTTIDKPSDYFNTKLYTGNGSTQSITGVGFQPDWVWTKGRSGSYGVSNHKLFDSVRGATKTLFGNLTLAESTQTNGLTSFDSDGFSLGDDSNVNDGSTNYASWNWYTGATASSNSNGSITSTVSANTTAGFSIVSYSGNSSTATVGHGLGAVPKMIIVKERTNTSGWYTYQEPTGNGNAMSLESNGASFGTTAWNSTTPTSSVFSLGNNGAVNNSGDTYIAYCFAEKKGYSKFGSYTGNGSTDGTFIYTGFKPAFTIIKRTDATDNWFIQDNIRQANANFDGNPVNIVLQGDLSNAETNASSRSVDYLSNGFKIRTTNGGWNASGGSFIYMAFAENPLVTSTGIPTTAR